MFSLINKAFIKETLQEECLKAETAQDSDEEGLEEEAIPSKV